MRKTDRRLEDILEAIDRIQSRIDPDDRATFRADEMLQVWVVHHLQIIGEAARKLPDDVRQRAPSIPWKEIVGMRHYLVHEYFRVDTETTWNVVQNELDDLRAGIQALLQNLNAD